MATWALILAAGSGQRFGRPKQFEVLRGERLVDRVVTLVEPWVDATVLVLPKGHEWDGPSVRVTTEGGASHAESTRRGLLALPSEVDTVLITAPSHPLTSRALIEQVLDAVTPGIDAAAPLLPLNDAVKTVDESGVRSVHTTSRPAVAQLPFAVRRSVLDAAVAQAPDFVEELDAIERIGGRIAAVPGDPMNLHVTTPADLALAEVLADRS